MSDRISFIRSDLAQLADYKVHLRGDVVIGDRLDTNESPLDLPPEIKSKLAWAYQQEIEANRYPNGSHDELKEAIAEYVGESTTTAISPANISVGNGSDELIRSLLIATCLGREGSILVANPTFSIYAIMAKTLGIPVVSISRKENFALDIEAAQEAMQRGLGGLPHERLHQEAIAQNSNPPIRVVFIIHPNSPTGNALRNEELEWMRSLPENILVVVDEAYFEYSQTSVADELDRRSNWIVLRTFSKAFRLAAHRVGYAIANPDLIAVLEKVRLPYNVPSLSQLAAKVALEQRQLLLPLVQQTIAERERVYQILQESDRFKMWQSQANFLYLRPHGDNLEAAMEKIFQNLKQQGTLIRYTGGGLRITIGTLEENNRTVERLLSVGTNN